RPTSARSSPSSASATGPARSCSPTSTASPSPERPGPPTPGGGGRPDPGPMRVPPGATRVGVGRDRPARDGGAMTALVEVRGLRKAYGGRLVVDGVDLDVGEGEIVGL